LPGYWLKHLDCVDVSGDFQLTLPKTTSGFSEDGCKTACSFGGTALAHPVLILEIGTTKEEQETLFPPGIRLSPDKLINIGNWLGGRFVDALKTEQVADHIFLHFRLGQQEQKVDGI
jgi:hypothetical protein